MTKNAPVLLFTYKRLDTLKLTISRLQKNFLAKESDLFIFSDAAKAKNDYDNIKEVRKYIQTIDGFRSIKIFEALQNKGLANSIIEGVTQVINEYGKVIVLEDDLETTPNFLCFMNAALNKYETVKKVSSISGYSFNLGSGNKYDTYFLNRGWSWGWATWHERWNAVDWNVSDYIEFRKNVKGRRAFAKGGSDLNKMLRHQMEGKLDSWAIRWFYHQFKQKGLTVYPVYSKVNNNGFDGMATHTNVSPKRYLPLMDQTFSRSFHFPEHIEITKEYQKKFQRKMGIRARIKSKIDTICFRILKKVQ